MNIAIFGFGSVGRMLSRQAVNMRVGVSAVADSSGVLLASKLDGGFTADELAAAVQVKEAGDSLASLQGKFKVVSPSEAIDALAQKGVAESMVVTDCSAHGNAHDYVRGFHLFV